MHLSTFTALNPGPYEAPDGGSYLLTGIFGAVGFILWLIAGVMTAASDRNLKAGAKDSRRLNIFFWSTYAVVLLAIIGVGVTGGTTGMADKATKADSRTAYAESVASWLNADYGIDVDRSSARDLIKGEPLVVDYKGADTMVKLVNRSDSDLAVRIPDGALLEPSNR